MQTSAETKAKEFCKTWGLTSEDDLVIKNTIKNLLLEHERDTRYTAIDVLRSLDTYEVQTEDTIIIEQKIYQESVELEDAVSAIHNLEVGN
tara:strand:+ start:15379 stop:15651 length:273 start_codon:yes stop_codon:yes gene_type:complete